MESTNSGNDQEVARKLERLFLMFVCAQEEWAVEGSPDSSSDDGEKGANVLI